MIVELGAELFGGAHRVEDAQYNLGGARPMRIIGRFLFEQLRVRENDPELIVQAVKEDPQDLGLIGHVDWSRSP